MSAFEASVPREALTRLEEAVEETLLESSRLGARLAESERRVQELDALLRRISGGQLEPADLLERMRRVEAENEDLRDRLERGKDGVERLLARIRFLEEQR